MCFRVGSPKLTRAVLVALLCWSFALADEGIEVESPRHRAWDMLLTATLSQRAQQRANGIRALGLLRDNVDARELAENALSDRNSDVRRAAATALGQMLAKESIPKLETALSDRKIPVVMAAAQSLRELRAEKPAYAVYYDLLTGERKAGDSMVDQQLQTLKDPKQRGDRFLRRNRICAVCWYRVGCVADDA